ncbi:MAG TPA: hypothetical protein VHE81_00725 [Lacipirellulaceae bacterium]|nr:hypothetical protein [Lacipirellulaceae bacterium]
MRARVRFSLKALLAAMALLAIGLGVWISYANYKLHMLTALRKEGAIVIIRDRTPKALQSIGVKQLSPFCSVPTIEFYVTPRGSDALIGNSDKPMSKADAQEYLLAKEAEARTYGATDVQLVVIDSFDSEWMKFAIQHSMSAIGDSKQRYSARLKANQESGANINP